jgi:hypothetical protein
MGTELVPETLYSNELTRLCAREDYIENILYRLSFWQPAEDTSRFLTFRGFKLRKSLL